MYRKRFLKDPTPKHWCLYSYYFVFSQATKKGVIAKIASTKRRHTSQTIGDGKRNAKKSYSSIDVDVQCMVNPISLSRLE